MSIPLKIGKVVNGSIVYKNLYEVMDAATWSSSWTEAEIIQHSIEKGMFPTEVSLTSETYSRDAERTADYNLENLQLINRKSKPEFTWSLIKYEYIQGLLNWLEYDYTTLTGTPVDAPDYYLCFFDLNEWRTGVHVYLGQTIEGTLVEYDSYDEETETTVSQKYWQNLRIAFPER